MRHRLFQRRSTHYARIGVVVQSPDIARATLHVKLPLAAHLYAVPFLSLYPLLAFAYYVKCDQWMVPENWIFLACMTVGSTHALCFLVTRWSGAARALITTTTAKSLKDADCIRIVPNQHRGQGEIVSLNKKLESDPNTYTFSYQRDTYVVQSVEPVIFTRLPYPSTGRPPLADFLQPKSLPTTEIPSLLSLYGGNDFNVPVPSFTELFGEHATAPFFVFQTFCLTLWCLVEYWYYSLFTLLVLVVFECTVVWLARIHLSVHLRTCSKFRYSAFASSPSPGACPYNLARSNATAMKGGKQYRPTSYYRAMLSPWVCHAFLRVVGSEESPTAPRRDEFMVPADMLLVHGTCIVNEAVLSGESTPLLKESIQLLDTADTLDVDGAHKNAVLFSGTKTVVAYARSLRTGFGTARGRLLRAMIFSTERVSTNKLEGFLFLGVLLIFGIAASWYVWVKGIERDLTKTKLLHVCVLIVTTSVVPPELPMELSLAVSASVIALSKFAIFCAGPFRIPFAGRVDVCCFDKTGTITAEDLVLEGVAGVDERQNLTLVDVKKASRETTLCLAAAHALVRLDDGTIVGDPMEKTTLAALEWNLSTGEMVAPTSNAPHKTQLTIRRRFKFLSALKRMSTISTIPGGKTMAAVKGAPETIKDMLSMVPMHYDATHKYFTRKGSRVLALAIKDMDSMGLDRINKLARDEADAVQTLKTLVDSSHRCIMITGDNPLTAVHVAREVEIMDRDALILDLKENLSHEGDLIWRDVNETTVIPVDPSEPLDTSLFKKYDICITGAAMKQYQDRPEWNQLVQNTWVYARVSPAQKELILATLKTLGYITLMAGDGTNDVGALKQAHIGVALLDGTAEDLKEIADRRQIEPRQKREIALAIAYLFPDAVAVQQTAPSDPTTARKQKPMKRFNLEPIASNSAEMEDEEEVPKVKLGDASCAAPFTSKLSLTHIIRQGRCTLVATIQMYKALALNSLINAYSLSVLYHDGIKFGDYQFTITAVMMSLCFLCISRAKPVNKLSRERPLGNIFNLYVFLSIALQFVLHIVTLVYMTNLSHALERRDGPIDLGAKFEPSLLNTAIYLLRLSQQVSTFAINYQGRPFRESISENKYLYWSLLGSSAVAFCGATDFVPELNRWLQLVEMTLSFRVKLTASMVIDFAGCYMIEVVCKYLFADLEPKDIITRGRERREQRRVLEEKKAE
ncbi:Cation-transporting ATPase [Mycena chlorophos]|uniref:Cation-transporting ATPase n=1 Tax=Mycena chlorophos TaxID=658473 RepID=A0A8H6S8G7_MYCCL|nr:Cation-transporting ATPase [Mycena chlorophos]